MFFNKYILLSINQFFYKLNQVLFFLFIINLLQSCAQTTEEGQYSQQRKLMVQEQIIARGIYSKKVILAMEKVERHKFVPEKYVPYAYDDYPLPIGEGQTISQPYIVALMTEQLNLTKQMKVLEIGTGSGYQAAILAELCDSVFSIEINKVLGERAIDILYEMGYKNIKIKIGDGYQGWIEHGPFDAIIVTCSPTHIPVPIKNQLSEGGKMIIPVGEQYAQELVLLTKIEGRIRQKEIIPVRFVPMINEKGNNY